MKKIRLNLITARKKAGYTQSQLGQIVGATKQRLSNLENGIAGTKPEFWDKLEDVLQVNQRQLRELVEAEVQK
jgi:DNA-binding XRE family transcriptional regulator